MRDSAKGREYFRHFLPITTRWADNDVYGHVNNVVFYQWFDTVVNQFLISRGTLDIHGGDAIALVVETHCNYFSPVAFPEPITAGLCVVQLGKSSVRYEVGIFRGDDQVASAQGHFVHVYVDRASRQPTAIPPQARALLTSIQALSS
ncbi:FcbC Predicted thioesterase [Oxalobacteraceae bacterium]|jgi:acyl-CoA thioester hydrolase|nr:acyl-CoA thioesterase [Oxalobacteraceae bacterium]